MIRIALCGLGYWGRNLFRVLSDNPDFELVAVVDPQDEIRRKLVASHPDLRTHPDIAAVARDPSIDAVAIATPVFSHYELARAALDGGKHVMIEKPMCGSADQAADLVARAEARGRTLMVDHTFLFHPAVRKLQELSDSGALGHVSYYDSQRINLGLFQPDVNVLWDLAPHDLAILDFLFGAEPAEIDASGYCHVKPGSPDLSFVTLHYPSRMVAHLNLSWMSPVKMRRIAIGGSTQMVVWDDLDRDEPLKIYDSGINVRPGAERLNLLPEYRIGSVISPRLQSNEPLREIVTHFGRVIAGRERCITDGQLGLRVVRTLERAQAVLNASLRRTDTPQPQTPEPVTAE